MKIINKNIDELIPYINNSRTHSEDQIDQIANSIIEFGFTNPVLIDKNAEIIAGHGRVLAAKKIGMQEIPTIELSNLTEIQKRAYIIADNKIAINAGWDEDVLKIEIEKLQLDEFDINLIGFSDEEIDLILNFEILNQKGDIINDNYSSDYCESKVLFGDIWQLGPHKLMCGDSSDIKQIDRLLSNTTPDVLIYDPPYENDELWNCFYPTSKAIVFSDYKYLQKAMKICSLFEVNYQFVWDNCTSWYTTNRPLARHKTAIFCSNDKYWNFDSAIYQDGKKRSAKIVSNTRGECDYKPLEDGFVHLQTIYQEPITNRDESHAHSKPVKWLNAIMRGSDGKIFLDLFAGSGASIIAAPDSTSVFAIEIDQHCCDKIISRWEESTGMVAVKL